METRHKSVQHLLQQGNAFHGMGQIQMKAACISRFYALLFR